MEAELKKQTQKPSQGGSSSKLEVQDLSQEVPEVKDLLSEIDAILQQTNPETQDRCRC
jgi:methyl-accepting chemotaxis protein